ncbi:MAG: hypothetical protein WAT58_04970 [Candidatus Dormiibacterota bacterium]
MTRAGLVVAAALLVGCSSASSQAQQNPTPSATASSTTDAQPSPSPSSGDISPSQPASPPTPTNPPAASACRDPHEHVYNPDRLHLVDRCMTISGTVEVIRSEADGDYHILMRLDPAFANLVNNGNIASERGDLVLEPVCEIRVTQRDAISACSGVNPSVPRPVIGTHYSATGAYVLDTVHGWMELHPLWDLHPA